MRFLVALLSLTASVLSANVYDQVTSLPGLTDPINFRHYSGFLNVTGTTKRLHYWYVESQNDPTSDPLVLWLNGGPGCSSLDGFLYEHGPFSPNLDGTKLTINPYSWNKVANVIYLESPAGVGFSYSTAATIASRRKDYSNDDTGTALDAWTALQSFFTGFPELQKNPFYIFGESYAGFYVPTLAKRISQENDDKNGLRINLVGFGVGNGIMSYNSNDNSLIFMAYYHGYISTGDWRSLREACCDPNSASNDDPDQWCNFAASTSKTCSDLVALASNRVYSSGINWYDINRDCEPTDNKKYRRSLESLFRGYPSFQKLIQSPPKFSPSRLGEQVPCVDTRGADAWLARSDVKAALHVTEATTPAWSICSDVLNYNRELNDILPTYVWLSTYHSELRILLYNGDADFACNLLGNQWNIQWLQADSSVLLKQVNDTRTWQCNDPSLADCSQVGGWLTEYQVPRTGQPLTFITARGSGHMVPQDSPQQSLHFFSQFLKNRPI